jgi:hypothetical protein
LLYMSPHSTSASHASIQVKIKEILESSRNPLFRMAQGVENHNDNLVIPVVGISEQNKDMAGERLAKAITAELTRSTIGLGACIASLDLRADGQLKPSKDSRQSELDITSLTDFLRDNLGRLSLKPHTVNLITVTFGKKWSYLSIVCSKESLRGHSRRELESGFKLLRQELLERFGVRLRFVTHPAPTDNELENASFKAGVHLGLRAEQSTPQSTLATLINRSVVDDTVSPLAKALTDWSDLLLCSVDARGACQIEDVFGEGADSNRELNHFDLRVCHPLAIKDFNSLNSGSEGYPALGIQSLVGSEGELISADVDLVFAKNFAALDADLATAIIDINSQDVAKQDGVVEADTAVDLQLRQLLLNLKGVANRVEKRAAFNREIGVLELASAQDSVNAPVIKNRAEVLVGSIMRFTQRSIMHWRDRLELRPAILVARPMLKSDRSLGQLLEILQCEATEILDPTKNQAQTDLLLQAGHPEMVKTLARCIAGAYNTRKMVVL